MSTQNHKPTGSHFQDLTGMVFGRWTVISFHEKRNHIIHWRCRCACSTERFISTASLTTGNSRSCGCLKKEEAGKPSITHGRSVGGTLDKTYVCWRSMLVRCRQKGNDCPKYKCYSGRGISVCERWKSFDNFLSDMGERPYKMTLDRIDNDGNYEPGNCRWATMKEQCRNRRSNRMLTCRGETKTLAEWCENRGIESYVVLNRLKLGWPVEDAIFREVQTGISTKSKFIACRGEVHTVAEWGRISGVPRSYIYNRLNDEWPVERAIFDKPGTRLKT